MKPRAICFSAFAAVLALAGCDSCRTVSIAKLLEKQGDSVHRDFSAKRTEWEGAELGAQFVLGDGLRTGAASTATLSLSDGSRLLVRPHTTIRFLVDGAGEHDQSVDVQAGEAVVFAGGNPLWLRTHVGLALLAPGTRAVLTRDALNLALLVEVGQATFRDSTGKDQQLGPGEHVLLDVGMAIVRAEDEKAQAAAGSGAEPPPTAPAIVAEVLQDGVRARERGGSWHDLARGEHAMEPGTGLRLPAATEVQLARGAERVRLLGAGEYAVGEGTVLVDALRGTVRVTADGKDVEIHVPGGRIVARAAAGGSEAALRIGETEGVLEMERGIALFRGPNGDHEVTPGDNYRWSIASDVASDRTDDDVPAPDYWNLEVRAGESFVVHAPEVPVAVSFEFGKQCPGRGLVEIAQPKRRSSGEGRANLLLPPGARSYTVRCLDARGAPGRVVAKGTAHVLADAGTRQLPLRAPTSLVDADGRGYTIYYQNQLPEVRVRWPNPPTADSYKLDVDGTEMSVTSPEHQFDSGSLRDGIHQLTFAAGQRKSRTATVEVRFDNTAATASLTAPVDRAFKVGDTVSVEGLALPAWIISVRDGTIEKVGADRFQGSVVTSAEHPDIAVRLAHRRLGTHYYLRRASGSR